MDYRTCSVDGCEARYRSIGYCERHYRHFRRYGSPESGLFREKVKDFADGTRECRGCRQRLALNAFGRSKDSPGGYRTKCGKCIYRDSDQDLQRANARTWHHNNPEKSARRSKAWRTDNAERSKAAQREYRKSNWPALHEQQRQWRLNNPGKAKAQSDRAEHNRRVRLNTGAVDRDISVDSLRARHGDRCAYCSRLMIFDQDGRWGSEKASIEHTTPLSRGGSHVWANTTLACLGCNRSKGARTLTEWGNYGEIKGDGADGTKDIHTVT